MAYRAPTMPDWEFPSMAKAAPVTQAGGWSSPKTSASFPSITSVSAFPSVKNISSASNFAAPRATGASSTYSAPMSTASWAAALSGPSPSTSSSSSGARPTSSAYGQPAAASGSRPMTMPQGFSSGALGPATQPARPAAQPQPQPTASAQPVNRAQVTQGGVTYTPLANSNTQATANPTPLRAGAQNAASHPSTRQGVDQYGRTFYYASNGSNEDQPVAGLSANNTVLKTVTMSDGTKVTYDTGATAFQPAAPRPAPAAPTAQPIVGKGVPVGPSVAVAPRPTATPPAPNPDDEISRNQGAWLV